MSRLNNSQGQAELLTQQLNNILNFFKDNPHLMTPELQSQISQNVDIVQMNEVNENLQNETDSTDVQQVQTPAVIQLPKNMVKNKLFRKTIPEHRKRAKSIKEQTDRLIVEYNEIEMNQNRRSGTREKYRLGSDGQTRTLTASTLSNAILNTCDVATKHEGSVYVYDAACDKMIESFDEFKRFVFRITMAESPNSNLKTSDLSKLTKETMNQLCSSHQLRKLKPLPSHIIATQNNVAFDLKSKKVYDLSIASMYYDVMSILPRNYVDMSQISGERKKQAIFHRRIAKRVFKHWGSHANGIETLLYQVFFAGIEGWNRGKAAVLKGSGGNGKSTYMEMLSNTVGYNNTAYINLNQWSDHNIINFLGLSTKVIIGDDAPTNARLGDTGMSNLKSITTGQTIIANVKFGPAKHIQSRAMYVQGTNTDVRIFENSDAIKSRIIFIPWNNTNWRDMDLSSIEYNLDELKVDNDFLDDLCSMIINEVKYFEKFDIPQSSITALEQMIEDEDIVQQVLNDLEEICGGVIVPLTYAYEYLKLKTKRENPGSSVMKINSFTRRLKDIVDKSDVFDMSTDRRKFRKGSRDKLATRAETCKRLLRVDNLEEMTGENTLYLKPRNPISNREIEDFKSSAQDLMTSTEPFTSRQEQMLDHLMHTEMDTEMISLFKDLI